MSEAFTLPQFINLADKFGFYLAVDSSNSLAFNQPKPDANCKFEVINLPSGGISLKGANGMIVNLYYTGWFRCEGPGGGCPFDVITAKDNQIYLQSKTGPPLFMTNYQNPQYAGLNAYPYVDSYCLFTVTAAA